jgi:hypothetical protein
MAYPAHTTLDCTENLEVKMARIEETIFVVKLSQLVRDRGDDAEKTGFDDLPATIEEVVQGLVAGDVLVEVEKA